MAPRIQYATAADGVSIAYWTMGEGPALVVPPPAMPWSHIQLELQIPELGRWYERLARNHRLVRYDSRGAGLSDRTATDFSMESTLADLEAVVDRLELERFALFGLFYNGPMTITYAALHPDRVSHLVLWCSFARSADAQRSLQLQEALERLMALDYQLFTENLAHTVFGWSQGEQAHRLALFMQQAVSHDAVQKAWNTNRDLDATAYVSLVRAPTIVIHRRDFPLVKDDVARGLAARIPDAHLVVLEGDSLSPYVGDEEVAARTIEEFLGAPPEPAAEAKAPEHGHIHYQPSGALATILFTDIEGSGALTQRLGDARARDVLRSHERIVRDALHSYGGSEVKAMGDGFMASFQSASQAIACAIAMQRAFARHNDEHPDATLSIRIGLNAGEPIAEDDDLFGTAVTMASRIMAHAAGGEIVAANVVRELAAGKGFLFADRGEVLLRGFEDPARLYEVRWHEDE